MSLFKIVLRTAACDAKAKEAGTETGSIGAEGALWVSGVQVLWQTGYLQDS